MLGRQDLFRRTVLAANQHGSSRTGLAAALGPGPPHCERLAEHVDAPQQDPLTKTVGQTARAATDHRLSFRLRGQVADAQAWVRVVPFVFAASRSTLRLSGTWAPWALQVSAVH